VDRVKEVRHRMTERSRSFVDWAKMPELYGEEVT
jgi:hypothetical protein